MATSAPRAVHGGASDASRTTTRTFSRRPRRVSATTEPSVSRNARDDECHGDLLFENMRAPPLFVECNDHRLCVHAMHISRSPSSSAVPCRPSNRGRTLVIDRDATPLDLVLATLEAESAEDTVIDVEGLGGLPSLSRRLEQPHRRALRLRIALLDSSSRRFRCHRTCGGAGSCRCRYHLDRVEPSRRARHPQGQRRLGRYPDRRARLRHLVQHQKGSRELGRLAARRARSGRRWSRTRCDPSSRALVLRRSRSRYSCR
jgi:hypothetical protein